MLFRSGAIVILVAAAGWRTWSTRNGAGRAEVTRLELILLSLMILVAASIILWLGPWSVTLQEQAFTAQGEEAKKAAYGAFFQTHSLVRGLYLVNLVLGIALMAVKIRGWMAHS